MDADSMMGSNTHRFGYLLIFALAMMAAASAIRGLTPTPFIRYLTPKVEHLKEHSDRYDLLFVGSSRVFRQISPRVFDERMRSHQIETRSFNAGVPAAKSVELWHLLRGFAGDGGVRARYVLIEPDGLRIGIFPENVRTEREIYWHGPAETALAIRSLDDLEMGLRARMSGLHVSAFLFNRLGVGRLRLLGSQLGESDQMLRLSRENLGPDGDGWVPFREARAGNELPRRQKFLDNLPRYHRSVRRLDAGRSESDCLTGYHAEMLANLKEAVEALGATPIFVLSPALKPRCEVHQAFREGLLPNLISFDDAAAFPELYEVRHRFDGEHLNTEGAVVYSRLLADRFADQVRADTKRGGS